MAEGGNGSKDKPKLKLVDNVATIAGMGLGGDEAFAAAIIQGRGHGSSQYEEATDIGGVLKDEVEVITGKPKK